MSCFDSDALSAVGFFFLSADILFSHQHEFFRCPRIKDRRWCYSVEGNCFPRISTAQAAFHTEKMSLSNKSTHYSAPKNTSSRSVNTSKARLLPKPVLPYAPVRQDERQHYLNLLFTQVKSAEQSASAGSTRLIVQTVAKEFEVAKNSKNKMDYQHNIKKVMFNLKKFGSFDGKQTEKPEGDGKQSIDEFCVIFKELEGLCIPAARLKRHNYVTEIPKPPTEDYRLPMNINCAHCGVEFKIDEISNPNTEKVHCLFHPGKILTSTYENLNMGKKIYGTDYTSRTFTCCNEPKGVSEGCKSLNHHVFKYNNSIDLHLSKPFKSIKDVRNGLNIDNNSKSQLLRKEKVKAIGLDCEMCYTDKGFEMMKISVVDFKTEKKLIDSIVHPDGELIIDLNSHVSGVEEIPKNSLTFDELIIKLAYLTDEDTILVGHGLENDLNVLRLIFPRIVDTAILFSETNVNVRRKDPLKKIAWKYLSENIQGKEHDSLEDAVVPVRIVKKHIDKVLALKKRNKLSR